jgi:hypothetical protein
MAGLIAWRKALTPDDVDLLAMCVAGPGGIAALVAIELFTHWARADVFKLAFLCAVLVGLYFPSLLRGIASLLSGSKRQGDSHDRHHNKNPHGNA